MTNKPEAADPHELDEQLATKRIVALAMQLHLTPPAGAMERGEIRAQLIEELRFLKDRKAPPPADPGCICRGNWRSIVKEVEPLIDQLYADRNGDVFRFFGVVHGASGYYYGMCNKQGTRLLSCVGTIEGHGYTRVESGLHNPVTKQA